MINSNINRYVCDRKEYLNISNLLFELFCIYSILIFEVSFRTTKIVTLKVQIIYVKRVIQYQTLFKTQ